MLASYPLLSKDEVVEEQVLELVFAIGHVRLSMDFHLRQIQTTHVTTNMTHPGQVVCPSPQTCSKERLLSIVGEGGRRRHCRIVGCGNWKTSLKSLVCHRDTNFLLSYPAPSYQVISHPFAFISDSPRHYLGPTPDPKLYCAIFIPSYPEHYFPRMSLFISHTLFIYPVADSFHSSPLSLFVRSSHTNMVCVHCTALNHGLYSVA